MEAVEVFVTELIQDLESGQLQLPTLPEVALRVRDVVDDENASANQIADIIAQDAALSARLIQVANSPLYRGRQEIDRLSMVAWNICFMTWLVTRLRTSLLPRRDTTMDRRSISWRPR